MSDHKFPWEKLKAESLRILCRDLGAPVASRKDEMISFLESVSERGLEAALATDRPTGPLRLPTTPQSAAVKRKTGTETPSDGLHNYGTRHREKRQRVTDPGPGPLRHRKAPAPTTPRGNESASVRLAPASSSNRTSSKRSIKKSSKGVFDGVVLSARKPVSNHSRSTPVRRPTQPKGKAGRAYEEETANVDTDEDGELGGLGQVDVDDEEGHIQEQEEWDVSGELLEKGSSHLEGSNKENSFGEEQEMSDEGVLEGGDGGGVKPEGIAGTGTVNPHHSISQPATGIAEGDTGADVGGASIDVEGEKEVTHNGEATTTSVSESRVVITAVDNDDAQIMVSQLTNVQGLATMD